MQMLCSVAFSALTHQDELNTRLRQPKVPGLYLSGPESRYHGWHAQQHAGPYASHGNFGKGDGKGAFIATGQQGYHQLAGPRANQESNRPEDRRIQILCSTVIVFSVFDTSVRTEYTCAADKTLKSRACTCRVPKAGTMVKVGMRTNKADGTRAMARVMARASSSRPASKGTTSLRDLQQTRNIKDRRICEF